MRPQRVGDPIVWAMSRADGCPDCINTEPPRAAIPLDAGAWRCSYLCTDCGRAWVTDWKED